VRDRQAPLLDFSHEAAQHDGEPVVGGEQLVQAGQQVRLGQGPRRSVGAVADRRCCLVLHRH
jgi:hypothetical protein